MVGSLSDESQPTQSSSSTLLFGSDWQRSGWLISSPEITVDDGGGAVFCAVCQFNESKEKA